MEKHDLLLAFGGELKRIGENRYGGHLVVYGDPKNTDLVGDFFTDETDFGIFKQVPVYYDHGLDPTLGRKRLGVADIKFDEVGAWVEFQLERRDEYEKMIAELIEQGVFGLSSGAVAHLTDRKQIGKSYQITEWPIAEASITPTPAEPRTGVTSLKSYQGERKNFPDRKDSGPSITLNALQEALESATDEIKTAIFTTTKEFKQMDKTTAEPKAPETVDVDGLKADLNESVEKAAEAAATKAVKSAMDSLMEEHSGVFAINTKGRQQDSPLKIYERYLRTGDKGAEREYNAAVKASNAVDMQEGTAGEGGVLVPTDHANTIIARRDEASIPRRAGARIITTIRDQIEVPTDNEDDGEFVITAEEGLYDNDTPALTSVTITAYKFTKLMKISEELLADETSNLLQFIADFVGRGMAKTENQYTLVGTGSSQPQGAFVGGTAAFTTAGAATVTAAEVKRAYYSLAAEYREGASWAMREDSERIIRSLTGDVFQFGPTPEAAAGANGLDALMGKPVFNSAKCAAMTTGNKSILFGNWNYYGLVDRQALRVRRLDELYAANGQVGLLFSFRLGGAVLQAEAMQYVTQT